VTPSQSAGQPYIVTELMGGVPQDRQMTPTIVGTRDVKDSGEPDSGEPDSAAGSAGLDGSAGGSGEEGES